MAAVSCRAFLVVRWFELSRVACLSSSIATTHKYRNETWCRRWWHISQRSLSVSAPTFAPTLGPILAKEIREARAAAKSEETAGAWTAAGHQEKTSETGSDGAAGQGVTITYHRGLPRITVPLPSRQERCVFNLKPISDTVGDFLHMLRREDRGIDRVILTTPDGVRIGSATTIESLMQDDFRISINDVEYTASPPRHSKLTMEDLEKLSDVQVVVGQLYETLHAREYYANMEKQVLEELEQVYLELEPLEQQVHEVYASVQNKAEIVPWAWLVFLSVQFGALARLTWWDYSWDIMEPVTYFVTLANTISYFIYYLLTRQEYILPVVFNRRRLLAFHKRAKKTGLDLALYNLLKERAYELETTLKIIRGPLYNRKMQLEQKKRQRSVSSSSSRSPSSSPSPSPSPSPERSDPKR